MILLNFAIVPNPASLFVPKQPLQAAPKGMKAPLFSIESDNYFRTENDEHFARGVFTANMVKYMFSSSVQV